MKDAVKQLELLVNQFKSFQIYDRYYDVPIHLQVEFTCSCETAVARIAGVDSIHAKHLRSITSHEDPFDTATSIEKYAGVIVSLYNDVKNGFLQRFQELAHGEVFTDFMEMARHLLDTGYKDAAAVMVGGALESHLRLLCNKHSIPIEDSTSGKAVPVKADKLNADLAKASVYSKLDQKHVTAWLDLRNKAAHSHYGEYEAGHVDIVMLGVSQFMAAHPA